MQKFSLTALLAFVLLSVAMFTPAIAQDYTPIFEEAACPFELAIEGEQEGVTYSCGYLIVPEDRFNPDGTQARLAVAIIRSTNPAAPPDPVIYLEGGPGGSALSAVDFWFQSGLRADRDIILIDQRGTGYSTPSLNCPEYEEDVEDPVTACRQRLLAEGVNIAAYTSAANADDIADLARALNLETYNLFGVSYGTRLALTVLRDHPERVRSVIIDAVYPPHVNSLNEQSALAYNTFETLFADCAVDAECAAAFPNLRQRFYDLVARLNANPDIVTDPETGEELEISGDALVSNLFDMLYDTSILAYLPATIDAWTRGDYFVDYYAEGDAVDVGGDDFEQALMDYLGFDNVDDLYDYIDSLSDEEYDALWEEIFGESAFFSEEEEQALMDYLGFTDYDALVDYLDNLSDEEFNLLLEEVFGGGEGVDGDSEGMFNSVECSEEVPFNSMEAVQQNLAGIPEAIAEGLVFTVEGTFDDCAKWDVPPAAESENQPVISDVPTLVLSGRYDPITPPSWGQAAADYLSRSYHFVFPNTGHGAVDSIECATQIALAFLNSPQQPPDSSCISTLTPPDFYIP